MTGEEEKTPPAPRPPLDGLRIIDLGHALAGPFAATMLADFGAEVIKIEKPGTGDPMRRLGPRKDGTPLWWICAARNKKSVTLDFTTQRGRELLTELVRRSDVVVENFRPGTLERHQLGWEQLKEVNPRLVMLRLSGFGQLTHYPTRPGFGRVAEAMAGAAELTGDRDGPPMHVGYSLADTLAGLMGAFGILLCLVRRQRDDVGDCIDLALYEPLFRLIDWQVIVYDQLGITPKRAGSRFPDVLDGVAAGVAQSSDGIWMSYSAATDDVLARLISVVIGPDALADVRLASAEARRLNCAMVEKAALEWIHARTCDEVEAKFAASGAVIGRVYDMAQIWADPNFWLRGDIVRVNDGELGEVAMHGVLPRLLESPGRITNTGPQLGEHTAAVLQELCGVGEEEFRQLREQEIA
jgi:crotonobetainyl-CoA:carnitine CoA-transferase CaiB-like acyl-CoA transferase